MISMIRNLLSAAALVSLSACAATLSTVTDNSGSPGQSALPAAKLAFAPLSGPPPPVAEALAHSFANAASARNLNLAPYRKRRSAYVIKGFISVAPGRDGTTAVYVWDVLSPDLQRLHRIAGQVTDKRTADAPWTAFSQESLDLIAEQTLDRLALWLANR